MYSVACLLSRLLPYDKSRDVVRTFKGGKLMLILIMAEHDATLLTMQTWCEKSLNVYSWSRLRRHASLLNFAVNNGGGARFPSPFLPWLRQIHKLTQPFFSLQGCYRFADGSSVKRFIQKTQPIVCTEYIDGLCYQKFRISAPIFKEDDYKASCSIVWHKSMFSVNDQPWSKINMHESSFQHVGKETTGGEFEFRVRYIYSKPSNLLRFCFIMPDNFPCYPEFNWCVESNICP